VTEQVLVVEDDETLLEALEYNLARQGYQVLQATDGQAALEAARRERPDLIVLDLMLPILDGLSVCRAVRREMATPILIVTARTDEEDRVAGLEAGADDYLTKPFGMRELLARVKALLRRMDLNCAEQPPPRPGLAKPLVRGDLAIDMARREVRRNGEVLRLKPKEYELLAYLSRNPGVVLSREALLKSVWGWDGDGSTRTVDVHICWLRDKIEANPNNPQRIVTVRGFGYRFEG
jgi:DNA-binding response OmpR family regulator